MDALRLAVVIVSYNSNDVLSGCIAALDAAVMNTGPPLSKPYDLVIVDNASRERPAVADAPGRNTRVMLANQNLGFSSGVNRGLSEVPFADLVLLLTPDARLCPNSLPLLIAGLR